MHARAHAPCSLHTRYMLQSCTCDGPRSVERCIARLLENDETQHIAHSTHILSSCQTVTKAAVTVGAILRGLHTLTHHKHTHTLTNTHTYVRVPTSAQIIVLLRSIDSFHSTTDGEAYNKQNEFSTCDELFVMLMSA